VALKLPCLIGIVCVIGMGIGCSKQAAPPAGPADAPAAGTGTNGSTATTGRMKADPNETHTVPGLNGVQKPK